MNKNLNINIKGIDVSLVAYKQKDYISLTDMAKYKNKNETSLVISHWLSARYTIEFLSCWEMFNNPNFNTTEFSSIKNESGSNGFVLTSKQWIEKTGAIGIISKAGRYGGGTFAHKDIAFEFATWLSAEFKFYLIKEFQRLKEEEQKKLSLEWNLQRAIAKINYHIHTDAIKEHIIPSVVTKEQMNAAYASEADLLNVALFGQTAQQWRSENPNYKGNIRDMAAIEQLIVLSNLESINALLIKQGLSQQERLMHLNQTAIIQLKSLLSNRQILKLNYK
jgi:hypothetical protein